VLQRPVEAGVPQEHRSGRHGGQPTPRRGPETGEGRSAGPRGGQTDQGRHDVHRRDIAPQTEAAAQPAPEDEVQGRGHRGQERQQVSPKRTRAGPDVPPAHDGRSDHGQPDARPLARRGRLAQPDRRQERHEHGRDGHEHGRAGHARPLDRGEPQEQVRGQTAARQGERAPRPGREAPESPSRRLPQSQGEDEDQREQDAPQDGHRGLDGREPDEHRRPRDAEQPQHETRGRPQSTGPRTGARLPAHARGSPRRGVRSAFTRPLGSEGPVSLSSRAVSG
jgi:hypothetical protein